ncbi:MAG: GrpB family protein, partial [Micrococcaceae bacterium]|nr:GrpB family protein [Micrococcaceae bacterium]
QTSDLAPDPRWPSRRRYLCVLRLGALLRELEADSGSLEWITGSPTAQPVRVVPASAAWSEHYAALADRLGGALGAGAWAIEHVGSTSVHGLDAKPLIDVVLTVPDPDNEALYVPLLEAAGLVLRLREPRWYRHRLLVPAADSGLPEANIHVFAPGSPETSRMLAFRDWLRTHEADRDAYARIKRAAAAQINDAGGGKGLVMDYNAAKEPFMLGLLERILRGPLAPRPRR